MMMSVRECSGVLLIDCDELSSGVMSLFE